MFYDKVRIFLESGKGGNGIVSFRREKYVPKGGPNGGNGGNGGSIYIIGYNKIENLINFNRKKFFIASKGCNGGSNKKNGKNGNDIFLKVPLGTIVKDEQNNILEDIIQNNQKILIVSGGRGGKGNFYFMTNRNKAPKIAENGEPGEKKIINLELKLLADVGLAGYPNVGKSTFISNVTNVKSKIDTYPFTTTTPILGTVNINKDRFTIADIPGLLEGASKGIGLGYNFLKHLERTKIIIHILDAGNKEKNLFEDYKKIKKELKSYNKLFIDKKEIIVINKIDLFGAEKKANLFIKKMNKIGYNENIFKISALNKKGLNHLILKILDYLKNDENIKTKNIKHKIIKLSKNENFISINIENGIFYIYGNKIEKIIKMSFLNSDEGILYFYKNLKKIGAIDLLKKKGIKTGDIVRIGEMEFDFFE